MSMLYTKSLTMTDAPVSAATVFERQGASAAVDLDLAQLRLGTEQVHNAKHDKDCRTAIAQRAQVQAAQGI
jgi:hypothetical protein